jgi:NNP family nitrate/nitrite transporter-like MFS transporter
MSGGLSGCAEPPFVRALPWVMLTSLMFLLNYLGRSIFGPLLPDMEQEFGISHAASTRLLLYLAAGYSISLFFSGFSGTKARPRVMITVALFGSGLAVVALSACHSLPLLAVLFVCFGLVSGQQLNAGWAVIRNLAPPSQWVKGIAVHELGPNVCLLLGPLLAAYGSGLLGWRGLVAAIGWVLVAASPLFFFLGKGGEERAAPVSFKGFRRALSEPVLWLFIWTVSLAVAGQFAPYSVLTLHMLNERHLEPETTAFLLSMSRISMPVTVLCGGWVVDRLGIRTTLTVAFSIYGLGMLLMAQPLFWPFVVGMFVQPACTAMVFPPLFALLARRFPTEQPLFLAIAMPLTSFFGLGLMPPVLGLWGDHVSFGAGFAMMAALVFVSMPLVRKLQGA